MSATHVPLPEPPILHMDALPPGTRLSEFELLGLLGVGGFGMVYRAYDHSLQRPVAIKEYMPSALAGRAAGMSVSMRSSVDQQTFVAGLRSFMAEARLLAQFDHPSLVKVFRVWEANNTAYMVMPFYNGVTLKEARSQMRSPPPEAWMRKLLWSVLEALKVLHAHDTVHRDVSPDNIFLQDVGPPVLLDLGAARRAIGGKTQHHTAILKVNYAPIEQYADAEDMRQGPWTDLYSLGAVVHGCLCNDAPIPATFRVLRDRMPSMESVARTVHEQFGIDYSPAFVQAVSQALAIRPNERPQSVAAFAALLDLAPPVGMQGFDWRAELGDIWVPPGSVMPTEAALGEPTHSPLAPQDRTQWTGPAPTLAAQLSGQPEVPAVAAAVEPPGPAMIEVAPPPEPATQPAPLARKTKPLVWGMAAVVVVLLGVAAAIGLREPAPQAEPAAVVTAPASAPASAASEPVPAPVAPPVAVVTEPPAPVSAAASAALPRPSEPDPRLPAVKASAPAKAVAKAPVAPASTASAPAPAASRPSVLPPRPETRPEPAPAPPVAHARPEPARAPALGAADLCPDSNFLSRPMCLYRECQKPQFAGMPVCIENNTRLQNNNRQQFQQ